MSVISKFLDKIKVEPGDVLYLGNKFDVVETRYVSLDRRSKTPNIVYEVPDNANEELLTYLESLVKERVLSHKEIKQQKLFEESYPQELKTFTSKPVEKMTMTELRYTAQKLGIGIEGINEREVIRKAILSSLEKKPIRSRKK